MNGASGKRFSGFLGKEGMFFWNINICVLFLEIGFMV